MNENTPNLDSPLDLTWLEKELTPYLGGLPADMTSLENLIQGHRRPVDDYDRIADTMPTPETRAEFLSNFEPELSRTRVFIRQLELLRLSWMAELIHAIAPLHNN